MDELLNVGLLRGLDKLGVVIETLPSQLRQRELHETRLKAQVQERLHQAGIEVIAEEEAISNRLPYLYVNVNIMKTDIGLYVFGTRVSLKQTVLLSREPFIELYTSTWETGGVGTVGVNNLSAILRSIREHVDRFCLDHLAENLDFGSNKRLHCRKLETQLMVDYGCPGGST